jgi:hypothetical protein
MDAEARRYRARMASIDGFVRYRRTNGIIYTES